MRVSREVRFLRAFTALGRYPTMDRRLRRPGRPPKPATIVLALLCLSSPLRSFGQQATPQVEVRINELAGDTAPMDDPSDDYVTWAPTFCRVRLVSPLGSAIKVVLTNDAPGAIPGGGDVCFAAIQTPWPVNTTAKAQTLDLQVPADGSWAPFVIAGKFGSPSTNDKDAVLEVHQNAAGGTLLASKALMVRVRKNANTLTANERDRFLSAIRTFRNRAVNSYVLFQEMHRLATTAGDEAHRQPAFLPWHRAMLLHVERELQKIDPSVAIPFWDWDAAAANIFTADFMGAPGAGPPFSVAEPVFSVSNPLNGWNTDLPFSGGRIRRSTNDLSLPPAASLPFKPLDSPIDPSLVDRADYGPRANRGTFSIEVEQDSHDLAHSWPCGGGHLIAPNRSAADPMFYLLHSNIERQWAYWQRKQNRFGTAAGGVLTFPAPAHYDNNGNWNDLGVANWQKGSFLEDGMWPWDGTSGGMPGARDERPLNMATAPGPVIPISTPTIPMANFPASVRRNLWPAAAAIPRPRNMIDYLGKFRPQDGLGFCYSDVDY